MTHTPPTTRREWQINPSRGSLMLAVYIDNVHCGFVASQTAADALIAEIVAKRAAAAPLQTAAYLSPRRQPTKATTRTAKKPRCTCPRCAGAQAEATGMYYCRAGKEYLGYHHGLSVASGDYLSTLDALNTYRYETLRRGHGLDAEQASDVLAARTTTA